MVIKISDLRATVSAIRTVILSDEREAVEDVQNVVREMIVKSPVAAFAERLGKEFWTIWEDFKGTQLAALDIELGDLADNDDARYLAVAQIFSAPPYPWSADDIWDNVLEIIGIEFEDDDVQSPPPQPKPRWMRELGMKRRRAHEVK